MMSDVPARLNQNRTANRNLALPAKDRPLVGVLMVEWAGVVAMEVGVEVGVEVEVDSEVVEVASAALKVVVVDDRYMSPTFVPFLVADR